MYTEETLHEKTKPELRDLAKGLGIELIDARRKADGETPRKKHWVAVILEKTNPPDEDEKEEELPKTARWENYRMAEIVNKKTGRKNIIRVRADGGLTPSATKLTGVEQVDEWRLIRAQTQAQATEMFKAGKGKKLTRDDVS